MRHKRDTAPLPEQEQRTYDDRIADLEKTLAMQAINMQALHERLTLLEKWQASRFSRRGGGK